MTSDGTLDPGAEVVAGTASGQKRRVDALDVDAVGDLDQLARGEVGLGERGGR
jgi:hypothetical protein